MKKIKDEGIKIFLDKERHIKFNFNTLVDIEDQFGSLDKMLEVLNGTPKMRDIRSILYITLRQEDKSLTEEKVGEIISLENLREITEKLGDAVYQSMPEVEDEEGEEIEKN